QHRDQRVVALDREALVALVRTAEEALEPVHLGEPAKHGTLLLVRERAAHLAVLDHATEPRALGVALDVLELEANGRAGDRGEISLGYSVEFGVELGGARRRAPQRIDLDAQVPVLADGLN